MVAKRLFWIALAFLFLMASAANAPAECPSFDSGVIVSAGLR